MRGVPLHEELWEAVKNKAESEDRSRTEVIRALMEGYVDGIIAPPPPSAP